MLRFDDIKNNKEVQSYIKKSDEALTAMGFTEHSYAHAGKVARDAGHILATLGYDEHEIELAKIAGYLHDIGNLINRADHAQSGAIMAFNLLNRMGADAEDVGTICCAIGNHDESTAVAVNAVTAALILADKSDVRRTRVRNRNQDRYEIHDRVNYAVEDNSMWISDDKKSITLQLTIDTKISSVMDYFEIFLGRMTLCKKAANKLGLWFHLIINDQELL
jgi:metal-dependent HD superfamily phosphatase/phosphodiesterase